MNFNDDFFTMLGLFITCVVQFVFYLIAFIVLLILAHRAGQRFKESLSEQARKQYKGFRIAAFICGGLTLLMLLIGAAAYIIGFALL